jgi:hypothetical protein
MQGSKAAFWHKALLVVEQAFVLKTQEGGLEQAVYCCIVLNDKPRRSYGGNLGLNAKTVGGLV